MARLKEIVTFLDDTLETNSIRDRSWNGLQVEGRPEVGRIIFAVDAGLATFQKAAGLRADLVVVHHGLFWKNNNPVCVGAMKARLESLLSAGISLYASHLPLDRHRSLGNNAQLLELAGARITGEFGEYEGQTISWRGEFPRPADRKLLATRLAKALKTSCRLLSFGPERVKTIAVCSGGGGYGLFEAALAAGVDLYLTGESIEVYHAARDAGLNVIFAGHHATETLGPRALAREIGRKFKLPVSFLDLPTGL